MGDYKGSIAVITGPGMDQRPSHRGQGRVEDAAGTTVGSTSSLLPSRAAARGREDSNYKLVLCIAGIVVSLLVYGVLQERIMTLPFGEGGRQELFTFSFFLVVCNRVVACAIAAAVLLARRAYDELRPIAPMQSYARVALSNVTATTCQYEALKHVSFAVATLGKCAKMFPVMLWGMLILRRRYSWRDVGLALAITGGCFVFFTTGSTTSRLGRARPGG